MVLLSVGARDPLTAIQAAVRSKTTQRFSCLWQLTPVSHPPSKRATSLKSLSQTLVLTICCRGFTAAVMGRPAAGVEEQHPLLVKAAQAAFRPALGFSPIANRQREVRLKPMEQGAGQPAEGACMHRLRCLQRACRSGIRGRLPHRWRLSYTSTPPVTPSYLQARFSCSGGCRRLEACGLQVRSGPTVLMLNIIGYIQRSTLNS